MNKKIFFLLAIFVSSAFLFSEKVFAGSCANGKGTCQTNTCSTGTPIDDTNNDCWASSDEICCGIYSGSISFYDKTDCTKTGCPSGQECTGWFSKTCEKIKTDCTTAGCPSGQECTGIFSKTCEAKKAASTDCTTTGCPDGQECSGIIWKTCEAKTGTSIAPVAPISGGTGSYQPSVQMTGGWSINDISKFGLPKASVSNIIRNLLDWLLGILAVAGVIGFVISGIIYTISTGDESAVERAKTAMKWSIVGVVVGLSGVVIVQAVDWALNGFGGF